MIVDCLPVCSVYLEPQCKIMIALSLLTGICPISVAIVNFLHNNANRKMPISKRKLKSTSTPHPPSPISCSFQNSCKSSDGSKREFTVMSPEQNMAVIPHHLRSKAAGANSLKKAARILAVGLFLISKRFKCSYFALLCNFKPEMPLKHKHHTAVI